MQLLNFSLCFADSKKRAVGIEEIRSRALRRQMMDALTFQDTVPRQSAIDNRVSLLLDVFQQVFPENSSAEEPAGVYIEAPPWLLPTFVADFTSRGIAVYVPFTPHYNFPGYALNGRGRQTFRIVRTQI